MTVDQVEELLRKYVSTGVAVALILIGPATAPGTSAKPQVITASPESSSTSAPATTSDDAATETTAQTSDTDPDQPDDTAAPTEAPTPTPTRAPAQSSVRPQAGEGTTAAAKYGWGAPDREDDFTGDLSGWGLYEGEGHAGNGKRSPSAATVANGILTIKGDAQGTTEGMAWNDGKGQKYGRWEGRVRAPASDPTYNALLLLWPDAENFPRGGEIDFMEMTDNTRQSTNVFLHHGADDSQVDGQVKIDATQWHNWAVEWTPKGVTTYLDGKPWWHTDNTAILPPGPMHLCIQLDWFPQDGDGAVKPSQMQVDWVRQYPLDGSDSPHSKTVAPTATPTQDSPPADSQGSVMRDVIRRMFGW